MFKAILRINHTGCWGSQISLMFPENQFSSIDVRWIKNSVAHIVKATGKAERFEQIYDYLKNRKDITNLEILSQSKEEFYLRTVTRNIKAHPSFSNKFFDLGCFPIEPTKFTGEFEVWTLGSEERDSLAKAYLLVKQNYACQLAYIKKDTLSSKLTEKQRHAFTNAKYFGYYDWPRKKSASEIAKILGITKTVFFSHLRKAEIKLLKEIQ